MTFVGENRRANSMNFSNERKVVIMRGQRKKYRVIQSQVKNRKGVMPGLTTLKDTVRRFNKRVGQVVYKYDNCGRTAWKMTNANKAFVVRMLLKLRKSQYCTSTTLQQVLAKERRVVVNVKSIQRCLRDSGYRWLPKSQKRKYSGLDMRKRVDFAAPLDGLPLAQYQEKVSFSMDGVILPMAPASPVERLNFCRSDETKMWRQRSEYAVPELAGDEKMPKQVPLDRSVAFWGGIGAAGAAVVCFHEYKKIEPDEWAEALDDGKLEEALETACFPNGAGGYTVICDNERFLKNADAKASYDACGVTLMHIPPRSPDLNPVERFWSWVRKQMKKKDLEDFRAKRPPLTKTAYRQRLRTLLRSPRAVIVAKNHFNSLPKTCTIVVNRRGAHSNS